jgi:hypothetical protein
MRALVGMDFVTGAEKIKIFLHGHVTVYAKGVGHETDLAAYVVGAF